MNPLAIHTLFRRAASVFMLILALSVRPSFAQDSLSLRFVHAVALNHHIADLSWNSIPNARQYTIYRHFPNQSGFDAVATLPDTHFVDTLHRVICADTVRYFVRLSDTSAVLSTDTVGIFFQDDVPTAPCSLRLCSVDTALGQIRLSWYPSPDTDVMGYYICIGSPCRDFDTVWGRLNTSYLCPPEFTASENSFRILAFDSCYQASSPRTIITPCSPFRLPPVPASCGSTGTVISICPTAYPPTASITASCPTRIGTRTSSLPRVLSLSTPLWPISPRAVSQPIFQCITCPTPSGLCRL